MEELNKNQDTNSQNIALTRFRALNFVEDKLRCGELLSKALQEASLQPWPDENGDYYAKRTLEDWWYSYKKGGFEALQPTTRSDAGSNRVLDEKTAQWIIEQVSQYPQIPVKALYSHWAEQGRPLPSISVVYRHLRRQGMDRASLRAGRLEHGPTKAFEAPAVNDLWMVDFSPGPTLRVEAKAFRTHLCVLIDDHSRLLPFAAYYPQANTEAFHHALKEAVLRRGLPRKLYTDQGKPFVNNHSRIVCANLGIRLLHARPHHSWSKGKIERVIFSIQRGFESILRLEGNQATSLKDLNTKFSRWVQTIYHQRIHSSTKQSPEFRFQQAAKSLRYLENEEEIEGLFYTRLNRSVRKNGTVRLDGRLYEVPLQLRALKVQLRLDPFTRKRIEVWHQNKFMGLARKAPLNLNSEIGGSEAYEC
jgi:putative transposase